jgi:hypothetical protein
MPHVVCRGLKTLTEVMLKKGQGVPPSPVEGLDLADLVAFASNFEKELALELNQFMGESTDSDESCSSRASLASHVSF